MLPLSLPPPSNGAQGRIVSTCVHTLCLPVARDRLKGVDDQAAIGFQAAAGLHHLMGNHWQILNRSIQTGFEDPLQAELQHYKMVASVSIRGKHVEIHDAANSYS